MNNSNNNINTSLEPFDYYTCTLNLENIDPKFLKNYMKFDNKSIKCGPCKDATLKLNISTCPTDQNGSSISNCKQTSSIVSSQGNPIKKFPYEISISQMNKYFCIE